MAQLKRVCHCAAKTGRGDHYPQVAMDQLEYLWKYLWKKLWKPRKNESELERESLCCVKIGSPGDMCSPCHPDSRRFDGGILSTRSVGNRTCLLMTLR